MKPSPGLKIETWRTPPHKMALLGLVGSFCYGCRSAEGLPWDSGHCICPSTARNRL